MIALQMYKYQDMSWMYISSPVAFRVQASLAMEIFILLQEQLSGIVLPAL
jgi:hypothetical protein